MCDGYFQVCLFEPWGWISWANLICIALKKSPAERNERRNKLRSSRHIGGLRPCWPYLGLRFPLLFSVCRASCVLAQRRSLWASSASELVRSLNCTTDSWWFSGDWSIMQLDNPVIYFVKLYYCHNWELRSSDKFEQVSTCLICKFECCWLGWLP